VKEVDKCFSSTCSTCVMMSGAVESIVAILFATSACSSSGKEESICPDCSGSKYDKTSAIVCGCSFLIKLRTCCGSAFLAKSKGLTCKEEVSRLMMLLASCLPNAFSKTVLAQPTPPCEI